MQKTNHEIIAFLLVATFLTLLLAGFVLTMLFLYRRRHNTYLNEIESIKIEYEKTLLNTRLEIQEQTFQSIAREIHDNINLSLTLAKLNLNTLDSSHLTESEEKIKSSIELMSKAIVDLSDISRSMNSEIIVEQGLITALDLETDKLRKLHWFDVRFLVTGTPVYMEAQQEIFIFRIVQEAYNNILKHAYAGIINIHLHYEMERLEITISDDGRGFDKDASKIKGSKKVSSGLINMQKRAEMLHGNCCIESKIGKGTRIKLQIPYKHVNTN